jgi:hypothetical protein
MKWGWIGWALLVACGGGREVAMPVAEVAEPAAEVAGAAAVDVTEGVPAEGQRPGDPRRGFERLLGEGYVGCGVPASVAERFFGTGPVWARVPGRTGAGAELPYFMNRYTSEAGVELVTANCLGCHAGYLRGELVIGLGDPAGDFTMDVGAGLDMAGLLVRDPAERAEWDRLVGRVKALAPHAKTRTVGANPADMIAAVLFAHRDPETLAWSDEPLIELPGDHAPVPVDVPAWWLMKKKTAMFWTGAGRGDHARIMMTASVMCVDDVATARAIDAYFPDIRAYIASLEPPAYPGQVDAGLAEAGRAVFDNRCAGCHGTYGDDESYPNRIIPIDEVGTDPELHRGSGQFAAPFRDWFNRSFYGEIARLEDGPGYVAPPLDGVWATAPYFHNGSVPDLTAVLDSSQRPARWIRQRHAGAYDLDRVGWTTLAPEAIPGVSPAWIYDTALPGYSNAGHTFGDALEPAERRAVLEYLKTL